MLYDKRWEKPKIEEMSLSEVYSKAADVLRKHGHCRFKLRNDEGNMCLWGAINYVVRGDALACNTQTRLMLDPLAAFTDGVSPVTWNNLPGRTQRQAISVLRKAARTAQNSR